MATSHGSNLTWKPPHPSTCATAIGKPPQNTPQSTEVAALIQKEIDNGWVVEANMSVAEAQKNWPSGTAVGKLNIVFAEGKEPRLVLDSTICGVNPRCHLPERVALPMASDIRLAAQASDHHGAFVGASIDFKAAHKQVKVREEDTVSSFSSIMINYTTTESAISEAGSQPTGGNGLEPSYFVKCTIY